MVYFLKVAPQHHPYAVSSGLEAEGWVILNASGPRGEILKVRTPPGGDFIPAWALDMCQRA